MSTPDFIASDLKRFDIKAQQAMVLAIRLGWRCRWSNPNKRLAILSLGPKRIDVPLTNINANRASSWVKQILRASDPQDVIDLASGGEKNMLKLSPEQQGAVAIVGTMVLVEAAKDYIESKGEDMPERMTQTVSEAVPKPAPPPQKQDPPPPPEPTEPSDLVLKVKRRYPYTAARGGGGRSAYQSDIIEVIEFENKSVIYGCKRCDYVNPNPASVRAHSVQAHPGEGSPRPEEKPKVEATPDPQKDEPTLTVVGVPLLTKTINDLRKGDASSRDIAVGLVNQPWEVRCHLAMLLLNGRQFEMMRGLTEDAIAAADLATARAEAVAAEALADRDKLRADLTAVQEMLATLGLKG